MTDTPRVDDAAIGFARLLADKEKSTWTELIDANFARTLERELAAAKAELGRLKRPELTHTNAIAWMYDFVCDDETVKGWLTTDYDEAHSPTNQCHNIVPLYAAATTSEGYPGIVHDYETLKAAYETTRKQYAELYDKHYRTPCEQIRKLNERVAGRTAPVTDHYDAGIPHYPDE